MKIPNNLLLLTSAIGAFALVGIIASEIYTMFKIKEVSRGDNHYISSIEYQ